MSAVFPLPPRLDFNAVQPLAAALRDRSSADLALDVSGVTHLGALCLQVLLAAAQSWRTQGRRLTLTGDSPALDEALELFGIDRAKLVTQAELEAAA
ncbi:STAS domain-containing protein [Frigidibacter sp. MR17.14]|uniref:STAS domain-containing protein n=1 Tax=Frigidibacter sp. MR17.14 TaxID=3126509 RepID=UPI003012AF04